MAGRGMVKSNTPFRPLSPPIAQGRTAEIYSWDESYVLKLYYDWCPMDWAEYEARIASAVHEAGIPSPAVGGLVEVNGRQGLIYERIEGISMLQDMNSHPWMILKHARALAEIHVKIHRQTIPTLPSRPYKDRLRYDIEQAQILDGTWKEKALLLLDALPDGQNVCHGDFHPGNILLTKKGPVVIDWMTACSGSRWADVARTSLILRVGAKAAGRQVHPMIRLAIRLYHQAYLSRYLATAPDPGTELQSWMPVIAAARLNENILPEQEALIKIVIQGIETKQAL